ncbi:multidrug efflux MFS transporter [Leuconostoc carnosum]|uniref:Major facilitator superfamily permease n=1 Tax=Leuconostoc carnosum (strain JB16) TaxID=1229758 RepID=K0D9N3_LEUCJ|nr:MFS transporter [Leuconostoc carnosum]AFT81538.1 major facilitator superfamily permease [Leuconostoc carnosum JB16]KAA8330342.1 multidrug efflux MFS transporter [Leuconostoc carnosum]KAA8370709.1 multidrug efflux MFS transporter [Leuconostoc carnosum]KAA8382353.1 multidrug efflux MFS transporter [Leuconostoc carnosum]
MSENNHTSQESSDSLWHRNVFVLWFGVFMTGIALSEVMPFLSLYIDTLGNFNKNQLTFYSGAVFAITFLVTAFVSPLWGKLADRKGRKLMLLRAALGMAIILFLMGFVTNVWQLFALRALQGAMGGFVSNSNALIATQTPKQHAGRALGILVTGMTAGNLLGPLFGGILATVFDYRMSFHITGAILLLVFFLTLFLVKEDPQPKISHIAESSTRKLWQQVPNKQFIIGLFITTMFVQMVNTSINPVVSLFVRELTNNAGNTTFIAGVVAAMPGIATVLVAPSFGRIGDRVGTERMIKIGFMIAVIAFIPTAFVTSITILMVLRFIVGISDATMMPAVQTLLSRHTPTAMTSRIFSYNQSFQAIGSVLGPMLGALVASIYDYRGIFIFSAIIIIINAILFNFNTRNLKS